MITDWTPETLVAFESEVSDSFNRGEIRAPVHLGGGNELALIEIFKNISASDWVCGTWRSHYHCLLKGVPALELKAAIGSGRSIALCFPKQRIICSAMVGGIIPVALGLAWATKRSGVAEKVFCFIGDMAATSGIAAECQRYATGHHLPLKIIVENNGTSVFTNTADSWGDTETPDDLFKQESYKYELTWPHVGTGTFVKFENGAGGKTGL